MILDGQVLGLPLVSYKSTKSAVESLTGLLSGMSAYATDTAQYGYYTGSAWIWLSDTSGSYVPIVHDIAGAYHSTSGRTSGQVLQATGAATFGWSTKTLTLTGSLTVPADGTAALLGVANVFTGYPQSVTTPTASTAFQVTQSGGAATYQYLLKGVTADTAAGDFNIVLDGTPFFESTRDNVLLMGYNVRDQGQREDAAKPTWHMAFESDYEDSPGHHLFEWYLQTVAVDGTNFRPIYVGVNRDGSESDIRLITDSFGAWLSDKVTRLFNFVPKALQLGGINALYVQDYSSVFLGPAGNTTNTASSNLGIGSGALAAITSSSGNVAVGINSLLNLTSGTGVNVAIGGNALGLLRTATANVGIGNNAGYSNLIGDSNTYIGTGTGYYQLGGTNVAIGTSAMYGSPGSSSANCVAIGNLALGELTSGGENVGIGFWAGRSTNPAYTITTGTRNTMIGTYTGFTSASQLTNATAIGYRAFVGASNTIVLGGTGTYLQDGVIGATTASAHWDVVGGADKVQLRAIGYTTQSSPVAHLLDLTAATNTTRDVLRLEARTSGTAAAGFGPSMSFYAESATADAYRLMGKIESVYVVATDTARTTRTLLYAADGNGATQTLREFVRGESSGTAPMLSFYGGTAVVRGAALTAQLTTLTYTAPGTPDYAVQDMVDVSLGAGWAFASHDEANSVLAVIANLQTRTAELEARLNSTTGVNLIA